MTDHGVSGRRAGSAAGAIYQALRGDIIALRLAPGAVVLEKQIAQTFGVSRTPVREALLKLADEGLIEIFPQSGTFVSRIPLDALPEALLIRDALEGAAARHAAAAATDDDVRRLRDNIAAQRAAPADDHEAFHQVDEAFHAMVADIAGYPGVWRLTQQVKAQVDRCRRLIMPQPGRREEAIVEHEAVADAIAAHDGERAAAGIAGHMRRVQNLIGAARDANPDYFVDRRTEPPLRPCRPAPYRPRG